MSAIVSCKSAVLRERARQQPVDFADERIVGRTSDDDTAGLDAVSVNVRRPTRAELHRQDAFTRLGTSA